MRNASATQCCGLVMALVLINASISTMFCVRLIVPYRKMYFYIPKTNCVTAIMIAQHFFCTEYWVDNFMKGQFTPCFIHKRQGDTRSSLRCLRFLPSNLTWWPFSLKNDNTRYTKQKNILFLLQFVFLLTWAVIIYL